MSFMKWDELLSVQIEEIDNQHKKWIEILNNLYDAMYEGKGNDVLEIILKELIDYTDYHFSTEEKLFKEHHYPEADEHIKIHLNLKEKVFQIYKDFQAGQMGMSIELMEFLEQWLVNHIKKVDKKYSQFMLDRGVK